MEQSDIKILKKTLRDVIEYIYRDKNVYEIFNVM
jgi:predicted methyltransferase